MRIAQVTDWFPPRVGGIEFHVRELSERLRDRGVDARVVTPWPGPDRVGDLPLDRVDLPLVPGLEVTLSPRLLSGVVDAIGRGRYDLVHTHVSIGSPVALSSMRAGYRLGIPVLATFHSIFGPWGATYVLFGPLFASWRWNFRVTAVSQAVARDLAWVFPKRECGLLSSAVEESDWRGLAPSPIPGRLRLVTIGRLHRRKRMDALVRIVGEVRRRLGGRGGISLEVLGQGAEHAALEKLVRRLGLDSDVTLLGGGDQGDVRDLLARGDVFVNACPLESFGIAGLEARAAGLPVVARLQSGMASFLSDGIDARLVSSDEGMVEALVELATRPELLHQLREGSRGPIPRAFTWNGLVDRHLDLYEEMLGRSAPQPAPGGSPR